MKTFRAIGCGLALLSAGAAVAQGSSAAGQEETVMAAPIVFFDIAGSDSVAQRAFYSTVFGWQVADDGAVTVESRTPLRGTLRTDPGNDSLLYFGVRDVAATLERIIAAGGTVDAPRFEVPGVVVLGLFRDPAGNRMGLVELNEGGEAIVP
jgi:predicted enzyme related to lactoylglutathione lyase